MATKWQINAAVKASSLPPPSRLIMFALSDSADAATSVIPAEHGPSLREIAEWTGLDKATVTRHLNTLVSAGWVKRESPPIALARTQHVRTTYQLDIGHGAEDAMPGADSTMPNRPNQTGMVQSASSQTGQPDESMVQPAPSHGADGDMGMVQEAPVPLLPDHYQTEEPFSSPEAPSRPPKPEPEPKPIRADVEQICEYLAARIVANGSKQPSITEKWRTEARLLLDRDGRTLDQVMRCIDWCQNDPFWRSNILSMPTLRAKYDQLRLDAQRAAARASPPLTEHNGLLLKPSNVANLERQQRMQQLDQEGAHIKAIEGRRS